MEVRRVLRPRVRTDIFPQLGRRDSLEARIAGALLGPGHSTALSDGHSNVGFYADIGLRPAARDPIARGSYGKTELREMGSLDFRSST
jgi:hypothetical protein